MLERIRRSLLARNTLWMLLGYGLRTGTQIVYFILLARLLGPKELGAFVSIVALVTILAPFASLGTGHLLVKNAATHRTEFSTSWGNALVVTGLGALSLGTAVLLMSSLFFHDSVPRALVASIALSELLFARLVAISAQAFQGFQRVDRSAQLQVLLSTVRLVAVGVLSTSHAQADAQSWGYLYLAATAIVGCLAVAMTSKELGKPRTDKRKAFAELMLGSQFAVSQAAQQTFSQLDKTILAKLESLSVAGTYGAASRLVDATYAPVFSLLYASYSRFFQHGTAGVRGSLAFARRLLPIGVSYAGLVGLCIYVCAPALPLFLGSEFSPAVMALRWLAPLPLLRVLYYFAADTLTGGGHQGVRSLVQVAVAAVNAVLNFWLIPLYSWRGAAWASLTSAMILACGLWLCVAHFSARDPR